MCRAVRLGSPMTALDFSLVRTLLTFTRNGTEVVEKETEKTRHRIR